MYPRIRFPFWLGLLFSISLSAFWEPGVYDSNRLYAQENDFFDFGDDFETDGSDDSTQTQDDFGTDAFSTKPDSRTPAGDPAFSGDLRKLPPSIVPDNPKGMNAEEAAKLLDKLEKDFLDDPESISPMEMIQAVFLFCKYGDEQQSLPFMKTLLLRFEKTDLSERELFDIADQLGGTSLAQILAKRNLAPENENAVERILEGYQSHLAKKDSFESFLMKDYLHLFTDPNAQEGLKDPQDLVFAANQLSKGDLSKGNRIEIAGVLLKQFLSTEATSEQLHRINEEIGSVDIVRILTLPELQPVGELAAKRIIEGSAEYRKTLLGKEQTTEKTEKAAVSRPVPIRGPSAFWKGIETTLEDLIEQLCFSQDEKEIEQLEATLKSFGWESLAAAAVVLESGNDQWVARCAHLLYSRLDGEQAYLLFPAMFDTRLKPETREQVGKYVERLTVNRPDDFDAATDLYRIATQYSGKELALRTDAQGQTTLWIANENGAKKGLPQCVLFPAVDAYRFQTARLAEQAYKIFPQQHEIKTLYQTTVLDRLVYENGLDQPRTEEIRQKTGDWTLFDLESVLVEAIHRNLTGAGVAAAELLGARGTADELLMQNSAQNSGKMQESASNFVRPRALVRATQCSNRRIRFAATEAVMKLKPTQPFAGSSFVTDSLMWFANADGHKVVIIACPKINDAMRLSGFLVKQGYVTKIVTNCRDIIREASDSPDVELVIVDQRCTNPPILPFAKYMYADPKTREIPVAILSYDEKTLQRTLDESYVDKPIPLMSELERSFANTVLADTLAMIFPYPQDEEAIQFILERLERMTGTIEVPNDQRLEHAKRALQWLSEITRDHPQMYRVENLEILAQRAAYSPILATEGIELVAQIRSNVMQNMLANIAMLKNVPVNVREQAASAFEESVKNHGILIRGNQVKTLLDVVADPEEAQDPVYERLEKTVKSAAAHLGRGR